MQTDATENINVNSQRILICPDQLKKSIPISEKAKQVINSSRQAIKDIIDKKDHRLLVIVGPCSIHDVEATLHYARKLKTLAQELNDQLYIVMRVYFEKPRTTVGWKGLVNDPDMDNSFELEKGLRIARQLLLDISELGLPTATETLDPVAPQYLSDLISWSAIGARTTESQTHRELASGLSSPVGFKNATDGSLKVATNAIKSASHPHSFLGINHSGQVAIINTKGNAYTHIVLRGGDSGPNYDRKNIQKCEQKLEEEGIEPSIVVDCSHANSHKNPSLQPIVINDIAKQLQQGNRSIIGIMIESNLGFGNQKLEYGKVEKLKYGVSITDACLDWHSTENCLIKLSAEIKHALLHRTEKIIEPA